MGVPKILIVDDSSENIETLSSTLSDYEVTFERNGPDALLRAANLRPDLILLDVMMPGMDGFEVCRRLKEDEELKDIPVIFLTGMAEDFNESHGFEAGAADYITKPYKPMAVRYRVARQLSIRSQLSELVQQNFELQTELEHAQPHSDLLPICMMCKNVCDEKGEWSRLEAYLMKKLGILFSHGICPGCEAAYRRQIEEECRAAREALAERGGCDEVYDNRMADSHAGRSVR